MLLVKMADKQRSGQKHFRYALLTTEAQFVGLVVDTREIMVFLVSANARLVKV